MHLNKYLIAFALCPALQIAHAAVTVGTCEASNHSYATISQAISAAHPGETIDVCPGTYPEQLKITQPLILRGVTVPGQAGATITAPTAGLQQLPANSSFYPQIYAANAGFVKIVNLAVDGTGANILYGSILFDTTTACQIGFLKDFSGIYLSNTSGDIRNVGVSNHFANSATPDSPQIYPNCGSGIEFANQGGHESLVEDSVINGYGYNGISATGPIRVERNVLTSLSSGPYQVGISVTTNDTTVNENTVSGAQYIQSTGILGGGRVEGNMVQGWMLGIANAKAVNQNTLLNNAIGISDPNQAARNLVTGVAQYPNPACAMNECQPGQTTLPTVGIDMQCEDSSMIRQNGIVGLGVGIANVEADDTLSSTNLYAQVGTASTSCASTTNNTNKKNKKK